jgi:hypothetical protein
MDDLTRLGLSLDRIMLLSDLASFVESFVEPATVVLDEVSQRIDRDGAFLAAVSQQIEEAVLRDIPYGSPVEADPFGAPYEGLTFASLYTGDLYNPASARCEVGRGG